ncbi:MAG: tryptophan-rich sensory protein [Verrucomicrobia bacterium]|nr:tryptophan-rich sensory protein [Verrucomicrobiota bacterium]
MSTAATHRPLPRAHQIAGLLGWLTLALVASAIGAVASIRAAAFYQELARPSWAPPGQVFGPVWTALYLMMGVASWLVWGERAALSRRALALYGVQLAVNALWSWLFFAWHQGLWAFVDIVVLWLLIVATVAAFWRIRPLAGALLLPYLLWVTFASFLAFTVWQLNPKLLG